MIKKIAWTVFLGFYATLLIVHISEMDFTPAYVFPVFFLALIVSLGVHRRVHILSIVALGAHMSLEMMHHAVHGSEYTVSILLWVGIHTAMDMYFLFHEIGHHFKKMQWHFFSVIMIMLASIYFFFPKELIGHSDHSGESWWAFLVVGSVLGCVLYHFGTSLITLIKVQKRFQ